MNNDHFIIIYKFYNYYKSMCYTNVVFNQKIARNVDKEEIEHQRINDRGTLPLIKWDFNLVSKLQALWSSNLQSSLLWQSTVPIEP